MDKIEISKKSWASKNLIAELMDIRQMTGKERLELAKSKNKKIKNKVGDNVCYWGTFSTKKQNNVSLLKIPCFLTRLQERSLKQNRHLFLKSVNEKIIQLLFIRHRARNPFVYLPDIFE